MQLRRWPLAWVTMLRRELPRLGSRAFTIQCGPTGIITVRLRGRRRNVVIRVWADMLAIVELEVRGELVERRRMVLFPDAPRCLRALVQVRAAHGGR